MISHVGQLPWENLEGTSQTQMVNNCFLYAHSPTKRSQTPFSKCLITGTTLGNIPVQNAVTYLTM